MRENAKMRTVSKMEADPDKEVEMKDGGHLFQLPKIRRKEQQFQNHRGRN